MAQPIHILTACHNNLPELKKVLRSLVKQTLPPASITVVDDGSTDGTTKYLAEQYPQIKVIRGNRNLWWTGSLNIGITQVMHKASRQDYLLTINVDCTVEVDYLKTIASYQDSHTVVGSHILDHKNGHTWDLGERLDWSKGKFMTRKINSEPLDALTTKGTMYPLVLFKEIGLLAPHLPHYGSDYELSVRAKRHGYRLLLAEDSHVYNQTKHTGVGDVLPSKPNYRQIFQLMFSRRSKLNIRDHFWLITLTCPPRYLPINYLRLVAKVAYLLVLPLPPLHRLLRHLNQSYNT